MMKGDFPRMFIGQKLCKVALWEINHQNMRSSPYFSIECNNLMDETLRSDVGICSEVVRADIFPHSNPTQTTHPEFNAIKAGTYNL